MSTTLKPRNLHTSTCFNPTLVSSSHSPAQIRKRLREGGCSGCELGKQEGFRGPVVYRGDPSSRRMVVGEAPGLKEDIKGDPFVGPAGELLDKIWASVGWDTKDWYLGNILKCRPIAPQGSGKQNSTPLARHRKACRPYIQQEIRWIKPKVIVLLGASALKGLLPEHGNKRMMDVAGKILTSDTYPDILFFVLYHTAALLHAKGTDGYSELREKMWKHITLLKEINEEL